MSYMIMTDTSANLPNDVVAGYDLKVVPFHYHIEGRSYTSMDSEAFDGDAFYEDIRRGTVVTTSLVSPAAYIDFFEEPLRQGLDLIYVGMSSGISGSMGCANFAAGELREKYPERTIEIVDTLGASLGEGLIAIRGAVYRDQGLSVSENAAQLRMHARRMFQVFTVDDLMHLRRGGRLSNFTAIMGTLLNIKPLLKGNPEGKIVSFANVRGRKKSVSALAEKYDALVRDPSTQIVGIAEAGCKEDAARLASLLRKNNPPKEILTVEYEPVTGSHVGPGALALFFEAYDGVRDAT